MNDRKVKLQQVQCKRCGHVWTPREEEVYTCAKCRSPYWNKDRKVKNGI